MGLRAGAMRWRVAFDRRQTAAGGELGDWDEQFDVAAEITWLRGSEPVIAQRLEGVQPVVITVRKSSRTALIETGWRARDVRSGVAYDITGVSPARADPLAGLDILASSGGPNG